MITPARSSSLPTVLDDTLAEALGRGGRDDPVLARTGGPAGNARLTAWTGLLILVLSLAELVTLLDVRGYISWHIVLGTLLIPPALLKTGSTGWRILRYYRHDPNYVQAGPPPLLLRLLGPGVVLSTLGLLGSGLILVLVGDNNAHTLLFSVLGQRVDWLRLHQGLFLVWGVLTGLHALARLVPALMLTFLPPGRRLSLEGRWARLTAFGVTAVAAAVAAVLVLSAGGSWRDGGGRHHPDGHSDFQPPTSR